MADTSEQQPLSEPHTNGVMDGLTEEEKSKMRPADIDADMREMERRKRVEMMMNSRLFREELERIIETQMKDGAGPSGLLQQISDMMGAQGARFNGNVFKNSNCVLPINDIRGVESMGYAKGEKLLRCKLAAVFRLLDLYGWTQGVGGQMTARLNQDQEHFLVNPYGLLYHEITASSLIKVDMQGSVVEQGTTNFGVHVAGFQLHSTIHAARPDIKCIVHITTPSVTAISSLKCGLLPIGQESIVIGEISTHQYIGGAFEPEEKEKIARNLGPMNKVMLLTNRGALCCGETVEEAFYNVYNMVLACETQLKLMPAGLDNLNLISEESKKAIFEASRKPPTPQQTAPISESTALVEKLEKRWRIGGTEFEALMRMLDNAGFRTGYIYRNPLVKGEPPRPRNDVEVPPAVSSLGYLLEEEELYKQGLWKGGRKGTDRSRWLNSPNVYQKVEILETGTPDPKKITKWVSDGSPTHSSTPVKIDGALQFVPKNTNPKEFKQIQQQIKDYRRADKISAGPQSHILEGVTWEEAKKMQDATISGTGEQVVLVGAASKGIIQRGFQHNAMVYKTPYAKNPFDAITDQELDQYKKEVERKQKGDLYDESQSESEALSSFNVSRATHESSTAKSPIQSPVSVTSETEEESRDEPRVLRIETKQVPAPSQPEVVLSDDRDSSSRYCSESESEGEYGDEMLREDCIDRKSRACRSVQLDEGEGEPRLKVVRSTVVAERLVTTLIELRPRPYPRPRSALSFSLQDGDAVEERYDEEKTVTLPEHSYCNREMVEAANTGTAVALFSRSNVKISRKYSLDRMDMSLIYSLTPSMDAAEDREKGVESEGPQWKRSERGRDGKEEEASANDSLTSCTQPLAYDEAWNGSGAETANGNGRFDSEYWEVDWNEGSDAFEMPADTFLGLLETSREAFRNDISDSANQIIAELNGSDNLINEIFQRDCDTPFNVPFDHRASSPLPSSPPSPPCTPVLQKETRENRENQGTPSVLVIREIIHHVIDTHDSREQTSWDVWIRNARESLTSLKEKKAVEAERQMDKDKDKDKDEEEILYRDFIETGEKNGKGDSRVTATTATATETATETATAADTAVFVEFRTIARKKNRERDANEKAFELNFRVETKDDGAMEKSGMHDESVDLGMPRIYPANRCAVDVDKEGCSLLPIDEEEIDRSVCSLNDESPPVAANYRDRDCAYAYDRVLCNGSFESRLNDRTNFGFESQNAPLASWQSA